MSNWIKRLFCKHKWKWDRNVYGDEINYSGGKRSSWSCAKCGALKYMPQLEDEQ